MLHGSAKGDAGKFKGPLVSNLKPNGARAKTAIAPTDISSALKKLKGVKKEKPKKKSS